jgi:UDP-N-acetylglucosamine enolpyruvyl transferase
MRLYRFLCGSVDRREVRIKNIPDIHDVNRLIEILGDFGVKVTKTATEIILSRLIR